MNRKELKEHNAKLFCQVIKLILELETIAKNPNSDDAKQIIAKYKKDIDRRKEQDLAEQN
jgi:hypothetical protein